MKIALFIQTLSGGGVERSTIRIARRFAELGHQVEILAFSGGGDMRPEAEEVARVIDLDAPWWIERLIAYASYLRKNDPDVVIAATSGPNMVSSLVDGVLARRRPVILSQRGWDDVLHSRQVRWRAILLQKIMRVAYRKAKAIVAVSRGVANQVAQLPLIKSARIHVIYNPVWSPQIETLAREPITDSLAAWSDVPVIVSVGRLAEEKDFPTLMRAFAKVREGRHVRLALLGEGPSRTALEGLARELGVVDDVLMPGFVGNPFAFLARSDVFVLSSKHEGFGNVIVEAMACGTPVVSTDCPFGPSEILQGGRYGPLVPVGDVVALAAAITQQLDDPTPANLLRQRAREFSVEASADAYLKLAEEMRRQP